MLARAQALLPTGDEADELYRSPSTTLSRTTIATDIARTQLLYGEWLRRARRRKEAREPLHEALDFFESIGASGFAARARAELAATGEHVRSRSAPVDVLTPQEAQIARLAASGERNREIAAQLYISTSTVEYHLRKIFVKLGVTLADPARPGRPADLTGPVDRSRHEDWGFPGIRRTAPPAYVRLVNINVRTEEP